MSRAERWLDQVDVVLTSMVPEALEAMTLLSMEFEADYCNLLYRETYAGLLDWPVRNIGTISGASSRRSTTAALAGAPDRSTATNA